MYIDKPVRNASRWDYLEDVLVHKGFGSRPTLGAEGTRPGEEDVSQSHCVVLFRFHIGVDSRFARTLVHLGNPDDHAARARCALGEVLAVDEARIGGQRRVCDRWTGVEQRTDLMNEQLVGE